MAKKRDFIDPVGTHKCRPLQGWRTRPGGVGPWNLALLQRLAASKGTQPSWQKAKQRNQFASGGTGTSLPSIHGLIHRQVHAVSLPVVRRYEMHDPDSGAAYYANTESE